MALPIGTRYAIALFLAPLRVGLLGLLLELCLRPTYGRSSLRGLLLIFGAALVIKELIRLIWGSSEQQLPVPAAVSGAYASEWSLMSMYILFIAVVTFRSRGLFGKKSVLET